jgi:hypothetical protein
VPHYYCIACDDRRGNNSRSRALSHSKDCKVYHLEQFQLVLTTFATDTPAGMAK